MMIGQVLGRGASLSQTAEHPRKWPIQTRCAPQRQMRHQIKAHFEDFSLDSFAPGGSRKPETNMIADLTARWPIDARGSFRIVGSSPEASVAGRSAVNTHVFAGGNLLEAIAPLLH